LEEDGIKRTDKFRQEMKPENGKNRNGFQRKQKIFFSRKMKLDNDARIRHNNRQQGFFEGYGFTFCGLNKR